MGLFYLIARLLGLKEPIGGGLKKTFHILVIFSLLDAQGVLPHSEAWGHGNHDQEGRLSGGTPATAGTGVQSAKNRHPNTQTQRTGSESPPASLRQPETGEDKSTPLSPPVPNTALSGLAMWILRRPLPWVVWIGDEKSRIQAETSAAGDGNQGGSKVAGTTDGLKRVPSAIAPPTTILKSPERTDETGGGSGTLAAARADLKQPKNILPACWAVDANLKKSEHQQINKAIKLIVDEIARECDVLVVPYAGTVKDFPIKNKVKLEPKGQGGQESNQINQMSRNGCPTDIFGDWVNHAFSQALANHEQVADQMCESEETVPNSKSPKKKLTTKTSGCAEVASNPVTDAFLNNLKNSTNTTDQKKHEEIQSDMKTNFHGGPAQRATGKLAVSVVDRHDSEEGWRGTMMHELMHNLGALHGSDGADGAGLNNDGGNKRLTKSPGCDLIRAKASPNRPELKWDQDETDYYTYNNDPDTQLAFNELKSGAKTLNTKLPDPPSKVPPITLTSTKPVPAQAVPTIEPVSATIETAPPTDRHRPTALSDSKQFFANKDTSGSDQPPETQTSPSPNIATGTRDSSRVRFNRKRPVEGSLADTSLTEAVAAASDPGGSGSGVVRLRPKVDRAGDRSYANVANGIPPGSGASFSTNGDISRQSPVSLSNTSRPGLLDSTFASIETGKSLPRYNWQTIGGPRKVPSSTATGSSTPLAILPHQNNRKSLPFSPFPPPPTL